MRLSYSHNCKSDIWFATGDKKMYMWARAIGRGGNFVRQGASYGILHSEENNWNEDFPYSYPIHPTFQTLPPPGMVVQGFKIQNLYIWRHNNLVWEVLL